MPSNISLSENIDGSPSPHNNKQDAIGSSGFYGVGSGNNNGGGSGVGL